MISSFSGATRRFGRLALFTGLLMLVLVLATACGGGQGAQAPAAPSGGGTQPAAEPAQGAPAPSQPAAPSEPAASEPAKSEGTVPDPIVFAGLDWDSALVHNAIARYIIENGFGYNTDEIPGSTIPMMQGTANGDVHIEMENWYENVKEAWDKLEEQGKVVTLGVNFPDAIQGFFVPTYMIKGDPARGIEPMTPDLKKVTDLPKYWELFRDPEDPSKGRFYDCIAGWACEKVNAEKFKAYGLDQTFNRFLPGTGAALATSIAGAYKKGDPWVGYYWGPTSVLGKYDMTMLEEPPYSEECWETTKACGYPVIEVTVVANKEFADNAPKPLIDFLKSYRTTQLLTSELLAYMEDNKAEARDTAIWFLKERPEIWTEWVTPDIAEKVKASLK